MPPESPDPGTGSRRARIAILSRYSLADQYRLAAEFRQMLEVLGRQADVLHLSLAGPHPRPDPIPGVAVDELPAAVNRASVRDILLKSLLFYALIPMVAMRLRKFQPDVIYLSEALPLYGYFLRQFSRRHVAITFGDQHLHNRFGNRFWFKPVLRTAEAIDRFELRRVEGVFSRGANSCRRIASMGVDPARIARVVYDVPHPDAFYPRDMTDLRRKCGFGETDLVLSFHGIMHQSKGIDRLLQWTADLHQEGLPIGIILVGTGPEEQNLRRFSLQVGLGNRAYFTGWLETPKDVADYCNASDVCVAMRTGDPSNRIVVPGSIIHCLACRKVVMAPRMPGMAELIQDRVNGLLFTPDDGADFKRLVRELAQNPPLRESLSAQAYRDSVEKFSIAAASQAYAEALLQFASLPAIGLGRHD
jgi:glycosyltransferase involved in cell wall biosynthesis